MIVGSRFMPGCWSPALKLFRFRVRLMVSWPARSLSRLGRVSFARRAMSLTLSCVGSSSDWELAMAKRKRRSRSAAVSADTVRAIKARKRSFLSDVSSLLSDALGFAVRVSMVPPKVDLSPDQRRASRRSAADNRRLIAASVYAPVAIRRSTSAELVDDLNDSLPPALLGGDADEG